MEFRLVSGNAGTWKCRLPEKTGYNPKFPVPLAAFIDIHPQ